MALAYAPCFRKRVEAKQNQHERKTRHQIETQQPGRGLPAVEQPFGERNLGAGTSQTQKGHADQQLEEPLGVEKPKFQEAM